MTTKDQKHLDAKLKHEIERVMPTYTIQGREKKRSTSNGVLIVLKNRENMFSLITESNIIHHMK
jgi:hypothetical protein